MSHDDSTMACCRPSYAPTETGGGAGIEAAVDDGRFLSPDAMLADDEVDELARRMEDD
jgi:hypothetical protein